jgi:hypothetical protein
MKGPARALALLALSLLPLLSLPARAASTAESGPIHLYLTFIRGNPVTTITVGDRTVQALVDTGGGAVTLGKDVIASAGGVRLTGTLESRDVYGHQRADPRFRVPVVVIDGHAFHDLPVVQSPEQGGPPVPNGIGRRLISRYFAVVDFASGSFTLWPPELRDAAMVNCGPTRIRMEHTEEAGLAVSDFDTQSGPIRLLWDTGATGSILPAPLVDSLRLASVVRHGTEFWQASIFSAGGRDFAPVEFVVLPQLKLPGDFHGLLGRTFFDKHVVCLDYRHREVWVR